MNSKSNRIDWNVRYRADLCKYFIESCKNKFGITEFSPVRGSADSESLDKYGRTFGFARLKDGIDNYFRWCDSKKKKPGWKGALESAKTHIQMNEQKIFDKEESKKKVERIRQAKIRQRKSEAVKKYGKPETTEQFRECWDYVDSYELLYASERRDLIKQGYLTDIPAGDKWEMKSMETFKPGPKSLGEVLKRVLINDY